VTRDLVSAHFSQEYKKAEKEYHDAFADELTSFRERIKERAKIKMQKIMEEIEEEERQKRLEQAPGGLDPAEVFESLPKEMQECFENRDIAMLQQVIENLPKEEAEYHMKRCVDSGLWIPDAKAAGLTPALEEGGDEQGAASGSSTKEEPTYSELTKPSSSY